MKNFSMKTKMALAISLLFVVVIALLAWGALSYQEQSLKKAISRQQFTLVSSLAANIDDKLRLAHDALIAAAHQVPPDALRNADRAQRFLDARITLRSVFDNGLFLISRDGELIAESPFLPGRRGRDLAFREYFQQTLKTGKPYISRPFISTHNPGHPAIFLSAPIFDRQGRLLAIFGGGFDLWGHNFLEDLSLARYGDDSYFYLTDRDRTIIVHPDPSLIMTKVLPVGANPLYEKALAGFEGSGETVDAQGVRAISSVRHLRTAGWILAAGYPTAEAYAPLKTSRYYFLLATIAFTCAVLAITWLLMKRFTAPLMAFTRHVGALPETFGRHHLLEIGSGDEIGIMGQAFNRMITTLEAQQAANESRLEALIRLNEMTTSSLEDIVDFALEEAVRLTRSTIGYMAFVDEDGSRLTMYSWPRGAMRERDKPLEHPLADTGPWEEALRQRRPVIANDCAAPNPCRKGHPAGHVDLRRHMNAPILDGERIVIVAGVGNKHEEYDETDVRQVTLLMQGVWRLVQRRRAEEKIEILHTDLAARAVELEYANQELEAFNYMVSHDLRIPLMAVNGYSELIEGLSGDSLDDQCRQYLQEIRNGGQRMSQLISALLEFACIKHTEQCRADVDLSMIANTVAAELVMAHPGRQVVFLVAEGVIANGDADLLRVVLVNLLGNAWKYTGQQEEAIIEFGMREDTRIYFVRDNGPGFDMADADRLFEPFRRLHSIEAEGHGIGLATVGRIIKRHGGKVWAEGMPGKGATFYFTI